MATVGKTFYELLGASSVAGPREKRRGLAAYVKRVLEPIWRSANGNWSKVVMNDVPIPALCEMCAHRPASVTPPQTCDIVVTVPIEYVDMVYTDVFDLAAKHKPVSVEHPSLQMFAIREVKLTGVTVPIASQDQILKLVGDGARRFRQFTIKCVEWPGRTESKPKKARRR